MKKEDLEFIKELSKELKRQDGGHKKSPYGFLLAQSTERIINDEYESATHYVYHDPEDGQDLESFEDIKYFLEDEYSWEGGKYEEEIREYAKKLEEEEPKDMGELEDLGIDLSSVGFERIAVQRKATVNSHNTNFFFTEKAFNDHVKENGHNLDNPEAHYLSLYRNTEMRRLLEVVHNIAEEHGDELPPLR